MSSLEGRCGSCDAASYTAREVKHLDAANKEMVLGDGGTSQGWKNYRAGR